jgi:hypothetical protein
MTYDRTLSIADLREIAEFAATVSDSAPELRPQACRIEAKMIEIIDDPKPSVALGTAIDGMACLLWDACTAGQERSGMQGGGWYGSVKNVLDTFEAAIRADQVERDAMVARLSWESYASKGAISSDRAFIGAADASREIELAIRQKGSDHAG